MNEKMNEIMQLLFLYYEWVWLHVFLTGMCRARARATPFNDATLQDLRVQQLADQSWNERHYIMSKKRIQNISKYASFLRFKIRLFLFGGLPVELTFQKGGE